MLTGLHGAEQTSPERYRQSAARFPVGLEKGRRHGSSHRYALPKGWRGARCHPSGRGFTNATASGRVGGVARRIPTGGRMHAGGPVELLDRQADLVAAQAHVVATEFHFRAVGSAVSCGHPSTDHQAHDGGSHHSTSGDHDDNRTTLERPADHAASGANHAAYDHGADRTVNRSCSDRDRGNRVLHSGGVVPQRAHRRGSRLHGAGV